MNAFNRRQWTELNEALAHFEQDDETRCVVLRGAGGNFSSGYDLPAALDELEGAGAEGGRIHWDHLQAKHLPVELGERGRVPRAEADVADTDHPRRFSLGHGFSFPLDEQPEWSFCW